MTMLSLACKTKSEDAIKVAVKASYRQLNLLQVPVLLEHARFHVHSIKWMLKVTQESSSKSLPKNIGFGAVLAINIKQNYA